MKKVAHLLGHLRKDLLYTIHELLLKEVARQQDLMVGESVGIVLTALQVDQRIQLVQHLKQQGKLVCTVSEVDEAALGQKLLTDLFASSAQHISSVAAK